MRKALVVLVGAAALWLAPGAVAAGWCGSGENTADLPDANTGPQFHLVYAIPSDGTDRFATVASQMADDAASIDTWWAGQDPTRTLRFDTARFPSCTAVDITFLRLAVNTATVGTSASGAFQVLEQALNQSPLVGAAGAGDKNYLVYYDGPPPQPNGVCGTGEGRFGLGGGLAVVWNGACSGAVNDAIAAHEALHALGALPLGAPNACPGDSAHPCDNALDVLYPYAAGVPLAQLYLDWNHDDYYAHSGAWDDIQDSPFLHRLDVPQVPLVLQLQGAGTVTSDEPGLACSGGCTTQWDPGTVVSLLASGAATTRFVHWSGACTGQDSCTVKLTQAATVAAVFGPLHVSVHASVSGKGAVACAPACGPRFDAGEPVRFHAVPAKGWRFVRWSGACKGTKPVCTAATDFAVSARATFAQLPVTKKKTKTTR